MKNSAYDLIQGGVHADDRGMLRFCNGFAMSPVKRLYTIANSAERPVRGWIGHRKETKWFFPVRGLTAIDLEPMDGTFAANDKVIRITLEASTPSVLKVAPGNWFCIRQDGNAEVMVFSDCEVGEYENDDFRRPL